MSGARSACARASSKTGGAARTPKATNAASAARRLIVEWRGSDPRRSAPRRSFRSREELLVLQTDLVDEIRIGNDALLQRHGPGPGVGLRIIDGDLDLEDSKIGAPDF